MDEQNMAANADVQDVGTSEGIATPTETHVAESATAEGQGSQQDVTQTQAFSRRLKEATEKARQEARDAWIAEQGYEWNGKPITTESEYKQAIKEKEIEDRIRSQYSNVPDEVVQELTESRKFREQYQKQQEQSQQTEKRNAMFKEFLAEYPDMDPQNIPAEVWQDVSKGRSLIDAYARYENKTLREKINSFQTQQQVQDANAKNAQSSTGAVKTSGRTESDFISQEAFEANKGNQEWVNKHFPNIMKSRAKWVSG